MFIHIYTCVLYYFLTPAFGWPKHSGLKRHRAGCWHAVQDDWHPWLSLAFECGRSDWKVHHPGSSQSDQTWSTYAPSQWMFGWTHQISTCHPSIPKRLCAADQVQQLAAATCWLLALRICLWAILGQKLLCAPASQIHWNQGERWELFFRQTLGPVPAPFRGSTIPDIAQGVAFFMPEGFTTSSFWLLWRTAPSAGTGTSCNTWRVKSSLPCWSSPMREGPICNAFACSNRKSNLSWVRGTCACVALHYITSQ